MYRESLLRTAALGSLFQFRSGKLRCANRLQRVVRGLYLNDLINPPAQLSEAAVWLRPGAVISLQTVLGDSGVWNNYTALMTVVVPLSRRYTTPSLGRCETAARHVCIPRTAGTDIERRPGRRPADGGQRLTVSTRNYKGRLR